MNINYEYMRIFYYVATYESMTKAAEVLHSSQPNVSRVMKTLEHDLDRTLMIRNKKGISLTDDGRKLYEHLKVINAQIQIAKDNLFSQDNGIRTLSIAQPPLLIYDTVMGVLSSFRKMHPNTKIHFHNADTEESFRMLDNNEVDCVLMVSPVDIPPNFSYSIIHEYYDIPVCSWEYSHLADGVHSLTEISTYPIIGEKSDSHSHVFFSDLFHHLGLEYDPQIICLNGDQIMPSVIAGLGIGFIPDTLFENSYVSQPLIKINIKEHIPPRYLYYIENPLSPPNPESALFKELLLRDYLTDISL